jgi:hypothetical protein
VPNDKHVLPTLLEYDAVLCLEQNRPANTHIYAVMAYTFNANGDFISLAGLDRNTPPPYDWQLEDGNVIWSGTLIRRAGQVDLFRPYGDQTGALKRARAVEAGGSTALHFPWQAGKKMMYGERGVHGGGFGISGAVGVDWVGGDRSGDDVASNIVYASTSGTVINTCVDNTSSAVLIESSTGEKVGYYHLIVSSEPDIGDTITRGQPIGRLRYGTFNDTCGWASQQSYNYHLHWVIVPSGGYFRAEGWVLNTGAEYWERGNERVSKRQWLSGGGGSGVIIPGEENPETPVVVVVPGNPGASGGGGGKLFDFVVLAINEIYGFFKQFYIVDPAVVEAQEDAFVMAGNMARTMIQDWNLLLVNDVIALQPWYGLAITIFIAEFVRWAIIIVLTVLFFIKKLPGIV